MGERSGSFVRVLRVLEVLGGSSVRILRVLKVLGGGSGGVQIPRGYDNGWVPFLRT